MRKKKRKGMTAPFVIIFHSVAKSRSNVQEAWVEVNDALEKWRVNATFTDRGKKVSKVK
jgi:hypothetical protein